MRFVAWRGLSDAYRRAIDGHSPWRPDSLEHAPITVFDVFQDASLASLRDAVLAEGIRALLFVADRVRRAGCIGKFMVYADVPRAFSSDECRLAETIGRHVAFGLVRVDDRAGGERGPRPRTRGARRGRCSPHPGGERQPREGRVPGHARARAAQPARARSCTRPRSWAGTTSSTRSRAGGRDDRPAGAGTWRGCSTTCWTSRASPAAGSASARRRSTCASR